MSSPGARRVDVGFKSVELVTLRHLFSRRLTADRCDVQGQRWHSVLLLLNPRLGSAQECKDHRHEKDTRAPRETHRYLNKVSSKIVVSVPPLVRRLIFNTDTVPKMLCAHKIERPRAGDVESEIEMAMMPLIV